MDATHETQGERNKKKIIWEMPRLYLSSVKIDDAPLAYYRCANKNNKKYAQYECHRTNEK